MSISDSHDFTNPNDILYNEFAASAPARSDAHKLLYSFGIVLMLCAASVATFGIPGLYLPAVAMVPVIFVVLLMITWDNEG